MLQLMKFLANRKKVGKWCIAEERLFQMLDTKQRVAFEKMLRPPPLPRPLSAFVFTALQFHKLKL